MTTAMSPRPLPDGASEGLLLVGHGSRSPASEAEMQALGDQVAAALPDVAVDVGFLEMTDPPAGPVLDRLVAHGCKRIVVLPLMLLAAGHGKSDVPAIVIEGRERHPHADIVFASPLGVSHELVAVLGDAVGRRGGNGLPLVVVARGTSDPDANAEAHRAARLIAEWTQASFLHVAFTGVTWPLVPEGLDVAHRLGQHRVSLVFWFLCNGRLIERARRDIAAFTERTGVDVLDAGYLGPDPRVVPVVVERYHSALDGAPPVYSCDNCAHRVAFPGLEDRVGQPRGVGHSHLAEEHRHHGHAHTHSH
ncbi:MAG TPA: sirohydrochlorin chelatase [Acidimicrobiales bacterium]